MLRLSIIKRNINTKVLNNCIRLELLNNNKPDNYIKGHNHYKGKTMDFKRNISNKPETLVKSNTKHKRTGRNNKRDIENNKKEQSEYDWIQV